MIAGWSEDKIVSLLPQLQPCYSLIFRNVIDTQFHLSEHKTKENRNYEILSPGAKKYPNVNVEYFVQLVLL